ncbi:MAG: hypothetical protein V4576_00965 [Patescibacteria group bacterium]
MKNTQRGIVGIIILVLLVIIGGIAYLYNKQVIQVSEITVPTTKEYSNAKFDISFTYASTWGEVVEQGESEIVIATKRTCTNFTPECNTTPEVTISFQKGYTLKETILSLEKQKQLYSSTTISGLSAVRTNFVSGRVSRPNDKTPYGYYKGVIVNTEKSDGTYVTIAFSGPLFATEAEANAYDTAEFDAFLSSIKI